MGLYPDLDCLAELPVSVGEQELRRSVQLLELSGRIDHFEIQSSSVLPYIKIDRISLGTPEKVNKGKLH